MVFKDSKPRFIFFLVLSGVVLLAEGVRVAWYGLGEPAWKGDPVLSLRLPPDGAPGVEHRPLADTRGGKLLSYDHGALVRLFDSERESWSMDVYYLEYEPGNDRQLQDMFCHSPEICLRASGSRLLRTLPHFETRVAGRRLLARHLVFQHPAMEGEFHVFKLVWMARMETLGIGGIGGGESSFRRVRLLDAWGRHSRPPARLILASLSGAHRDDEARALFEREIVARCVFLPAGTP